MNDPSSSQQIHATCVAIGGAGVLLRGPSASGKSDVALRLIDGGAVLVADDRVDLTRDGDVLIASCPHEIAGLIEVRGVGIVRPAHNQSSAAVALIVDLVAPGEVERLPEPMHAAILGARVPLLRLHAFDAATPAKIRLVLDRANGAIVQPI